MTDARPDREIQKKGPRLSPGAKVRHDCARYGALSEQSANKRIADWVPLGARP